MKYSYTEFINGLINLGYKFVVSPESDKIVVEVSFNLSCFGHGDEIVPPKELPKSPYKTIMRKGEECDEFYIVFSWSFVNEWPIEPPRQ